MVDNTVQLIAYADRLAGDIPSLTRLLSSEPWASAFGGVHLLPFFTPYDGADAGFDPIDHTQVDPRLGTWSDVAALAAGRDVVVDLIVNHVSSHSAPFQDFLARGDRSEYAEMFLTLSSVFPEGATEEQLATIYRPRPGLPFTPYVCAGTRRLVWTTFTSEQVDLDVGSAQGRQYLDAILATVAAAGVRMVRLDAVGYAVKAAGSSCFMTPQTFSFIDAFTAEARGRGVEVLVEVHSYYRRQVEIGSRVDRVYDFALPPLLLHSFRSGSATALAHWIDIRPTNAITVLDTHDGIGVIDIGPEQVAAGLRGGPGLVDDDDIDALVEWIHANTAGESRLATGAASSNLDLYQVNSTYFDALGRDARRYLLARAIQLFLPGVPQVYYVGALCGRNDLELLARTRVGRDINRHHYTADEVAAALQDPTVDALLRLCAWRNTASAFAGVFTHALDQDGRVLHLTWEHADERAELVGDLASGTSRLVWTAGGATHRTDDLLGAPPVAAPRVAARPASASS